MNLNPVYLVFLDHNTIHEYNEIVSDKLDVPPNFDLVIGNWFRVRPTSEEAIIIKLKFRGFAPSYAFGSNNISKLYE